MACWHSLLSPRVQATRDELQSLPGRGGGGGLESVWKTIPHLSPTRHSLWLSFPTNSPWDSSRLLVTTPHCLVTSCPRSKTATHLLLPQHTERDRRVMRHLEFPGEMTEARGWALLSVSQWVSRGPEPQVIFLSLRLILFSPGPAWHGPCWPPHTQLTSHCHQPWLPYYSSDKPALSYPWAFSLHVFPHLGTSMSLDFSIQVTTSKRPSLITLK